MRARLVPTLAALALVLMLPASAVATSPRDQEYQGIFTGAMMAGCTVTPMGVTGDVPFKAMGEWEVTIEGDAANVSATIYADMGWGWFLVDSFTGDAYGTWQVLRHGHNFQLQIAHDNMSGAQVDFDLVGRQLEFRITPYVFPGFWECAYGVTYGELR